MSLPGNLQGEWEFGINWDTRKHPTSTFTAKFNQDGSISIIDSNKNQGAWIQGTEVSNSRVSLGFLWGSDYWIFEGNISNHTASDTMDGTSVGVLTPETYFRGAWVATRKK